MISITQTYVLSLPVDSVRRAHIRQHFEETGLNWFEFVDAIPSTHPDVARLYREGRVAHYPPCFRCGFDLCDCDNNILIPPQIANWLSFRKIWQNLPADPEKFYLICEDDVAFHDGAKGLLDRFLNDFSPSQEQVLVRLAQSGEQPFRKLDEISLQLSPRAVMSNAAYIINGALAARLAQEDQRIAHTSDVWLHRDIAAKPDVQAITVEPLLATDLSYNREFAQFVSRIHPKGIDRHDEIRQQRHIKRVASSDEYRVLRRIWSSSPSRRRTCLRPYEKEQSKNES